MPDGYTSVDARDGYRTGIPRRLLRDSFHFGDRLVDDRVQIEAGIADRVLRKVLEEMFRDEELTATGGLLDASALID